MKKAMSLFLALSLVLSSGHMSDAKIRVVSKGLKKGDFTYSVYKIGDCAIRAVVNLDAYNGSAEHVRLPAEIRHMQVRGLPTRYKHPKKIKKITLKEQFGYEGEFASLPNLKSVKMKKNTCSSYSKKGVLFHDYMGGIWLNVYPRGKKEKNYCVPEKVAVIGSYAFANCKNLKSITLPEKLIEINDHAFQGCKSLKKLKIPKWVNYIGAGAFKKCKARVVMSPYMKKVKESTEQEAHYELFVDSRLKDEPDAKIQQMPYRAFDEIQPDAKQIEIAKGKNHTLVTHFKIDQVWYTLLSDGLQYRSSNPEVATVDDHGVVTAKKKGTAKITVRHLYLYNYHNYVAGKYNVSVTVKND